MLNIVIVSLGRASLQRSTHCSHVLAGNATLGPSPPCKAASTQEFTQINTQVSEFKSHRKDRDMIKDTNTTSTLVSRDLKSSTEETDTYQLTRGQPSAREGNSSLQNKGGGSRQVLMRKERGRRVRKVWLPEEEVSRHQMSFQLASMLDW